jgi:cation diffusion facilitator CzcD-associated flavoprotein CzcO
MLRTILINATAVAAATVIGAAASAETLTPNDLADAISTLQVAESDCLLVFPPDLEEQFTLRALRAMGGVTQDHARELRAAVQNKVDYARRTWSTGPGSAYCRNNVRYLMKAWRLYILDATE